MRDFTDEQIAMFNNLLNNIGTEIQTKLRGSVYKDAELYYRGTITLLTLRVIDDSKGVITGHIYKDKVLKKSVSYPISLRSSKAPIVFIAQIVEEIN